MDMKGLFKQDTFRDYTVRKATDQDAETVIQMIREAAGWLADKGIHQWDYYLTDEAMLEINQAIKAGTTYLIENQEKYAVTTFNLSLEQSELDISVWGNRNDRALYLHRLAVDKNYRHKRIGKGLLEWICVNSLLDDGVIRLDCVADNPALNQFYVNAGFTFSGYVRAKEIQFSRYERPLNA
ncbi:GNAT family N-acetyltransferase [Lentibacillus cibarius]|uniref:GNAT family N-acetyltransferase n=2 Tax=Lentibacillus cibarius TaxID=2583219 RepID=A0A549YHJ5_9BACI|nr:GNAT family N-acetyltransferase [Lentibacillus cibarius]